MAAITLLARKKLCTPLASSIALMSSLMPTAPSCAWRISARRTCSGAGSTTMSRVKPLGTPASASFALARPGS
ncbi:MAG: hypothetical protein A3F92_13260 [Candidatus Rokubacteria bacterium RIFCSPLOWO2_12_FULL_71_22]|nr:MAG: hypothetical protein A3F92_13260 [Candidatus Rokubacteria bacterium RIFCSPLOWO2_12_FULL_71_22]